MPSLESASLNEWESILEIDSYYNPLDTQDMNQLGTAGAETGGLVVMAGGVDEV